jgi:hypothetical protein
MRLASVIAWHGKSRSIRACSRVRPAPVRRDRERLVTLFVTVFCLGRAESPQQRRHALEVSVRPELLGYELYGPAP